LKVNGASCLFLLYDINRYDSDHTFVTFLIPQASNFQAKMLWFDISYAFDKTNEIPSGAYLFVNGLMNSFRVIMNQSYSYFSILSLKQFELLLKCYFLL